MDKILNILKYNIYGGEQMINKYIYMYREDIENDTHFIYQINSILNSKHPYKYGCNRLYILNVPKDKKKKAYIYDNLKELELTNNDTLYNMSIDEYLTIFKSFINLSGTTLKIDKNTFITQFIT